MGALIGRRHQVAPLKTLLHINLERAELGDVKCSYKVDLINRPWRTDLGSLRRVCISVICSYCRGVP